MSAIVSILPKGEGFSPDHSGGIGLCVRDFALNSRWRSEIRIIGGVGGRGFDGIAYTALAPAPWYQNRTRAYARGCAEIIRREQARLAEIHNRPAMLDMLKDKAECAFALHLHNDPRDMEGARTPNERKKVLALAGGVYCVSSYIRDCFLEGLDKDTAAKLHVVPNGIAIPASLPPKENLIVFAGRMTEDKGALVLAQALALALPKLPGWHAALIGSRRHEHSDALTPYEMAVKEALAPVAAQVAIPGFLPYAETMDYFARASVAVVPSVWAEPFGRSAIEAFAYGAALISSGSGALSEVTQDAALTVNPLTPPALAEAISRIATDHAQRARLQQAGAKRVRDFSLAACTALLDNARDAILTQGKSHAA